jgi:hypothetical protein
MIDSLGEVGAALNDAKPDSLSQLYQRLRLDLRYKPHENALTVTSNLRVVSAGVRGGVAHYPPVTGSVSELCRTGGSWG